MHTRELPELVSDERPCMWVLHKPAGVDTDLAPGSDLRVMIRDHDIDKRAHHIGRLDRDTSGLLLFSNDGDVTYSILNSPTLRKTYLAQVSCSPTPHHLTELCEGVVLSDGIARAWSAEIINECNCCPEEIRPLFLNARVRPIEKHNYYIRIVTNDGRNRVVRRMLAAVGLPVLSLHREAVGPISLPENSVPGSFFPLSASSVSDLLKASTHTDEIHS